MRGLFPWRLVQTLNSPLGVWIGIMRTPPARRSARLLSSRYGWIAFTRASVREVGGGKHEAVDDWLGDLGELLELLRIDRVQRDKERVIAVRKVSVSHEDPRNLVATDGVEVIYPVLRVGEQRDTARIVGTLVQPEV